MTGLQIALDKVRQVQVACQDTVFPYHPDTREGMAEIFEDRPSSKPLAITTVAFARKFCAEDPYYTWRKL